MGTRSRRNKVIDLDSSLSGIGNCGEPTGYCDQAALTLVRGEFDPPRYQTCNIPHEIFFHYFIVLFRGERPCNSIGISFSLASKFLSDALLAHDSLGCPGIILLMS